MDRRLISGSSALAAADLPERIKRRVRESEGCWEWAGAHTTAGYAETSFGDPKKGGMRYAHRVVYEALVGPIPSGLTIDHLCRNPGCVNPEHLEPVTIGENLRRKPVPSHCPQGHAFTADNTIRNAKGHRFCLTCKRARGRDWSQRTYERRREYQRRWREAHREELKAYNAAYHARKMPA
jgi:hypothetical protein